VRNPPEVNRLRVGGPDDVMGRKERDRSPGGELAHHKKTPTPKNQHHPPKNENNESKYQKKKQTKKTKKQKKKKNTSPWISIITDEKF